MSRILVTAIPQLTEAHRGRIRAAAERQGLEALFFERDGDALPALAGAEILFAQSADLAAAAPALRWQCTPSAGVDHFSPETFAASGAVLTNSSGAYGVTIAEHVILVILQLLRRQPEYADIIARRQWQRDLAIRSIHGSRALLLGTGDIGRETARRLRGFAPASVTGMNRSGRNPENLFDRIIPEGELDAALPEADLVILSLPGTAETAHVLDRRRLSRLPDGALLVNVGRGVAVDQAALEAELRAGRLYAALDVFEREPIPADASLWQCPNLLITPHAAGNMTLPYTLDRIVELFLQDLENYGAGRPLERRVDLRRGY